MVLENCKWNEIKDLGQVNFRGLKLLYRAILKGLQIHALFALYPVMKSTSIDIVDLVKHLFQIEWLASFNSCTKFLNFTALLYMNIWIEDKCIRLTKPKSPPDPYVWTPNSHPCTIWICYEHLTHHGWEELWACMLVITLETSRIWVLKGSLGRHKKNTWDVIVHTHFILGFYRLDLHIKTCIPLVNKSTMKHLQKLDWNWISPYLFMVITSACLLIFLIGYISPPSYVHLSVE